MKNICFTGRWNVSENFAVTTTPGAFFEYKFIGKMAVMHFETQWLNMPAPHLWIQVDSGTMVETAVDKHLRIHVEDGSEEHTVKVIFKSANEMAHRWFNPLGACIELTGIEADIIKSGMSSKKTIEFVGDSITEGVLIDSLTGTGAKFFDRPYEDDSTATFAWITAEKMNMRPLIVGYGGVGVTKGGSGGVPLAQEIYPYCYSGVQRNYPSPDIVILNYGANDRNSSEEMFVRGYEELLKVVDSVNLKSTIFVVSPFCGAHESSLCALVNRFSSTRNKISYIPSTGWLPENSPIHPNRYWHRKIADNLTYEIQKELIK